MTQTRGPIHNNFNPNWRIVKYIFVIVGAKIQAKWNDVF